ncbi:MAG: methyltransferase domain-containing protein [Saprospiraceae bacterium]
MTNIHKSVQNYYGQELSKSEDLKTNACCTLVQPPKHIVNAMNNIHDEVMSKYYGCGLTIPNQVKNLTILDLGSGSGRDVYIAAQLVGEHGTVVGVDMTQEQLDVANKYIEHHREKFGYQASNVSFIKGNIDDLSNIDIEKESIDIIISNCVINLVENKAKVLADAFDLLKPGGEMYFSDVYCNRRIPQYLQDNQVLWGECLSGAMYWNDFLRAAKNAGFTDPRTMESHPITIENRDLEETVGALKFYSVTYRLWKIDGLESDCEDFGQAVSYKGSIDYNPNIFELDDHHVFEKGNIMSVCGNTYKMLHETRFKAHFDFYGTWDTHYGIFEGCGRAMPFGDSITSDEGGSCC